MELKNTRFYKAVNKKVGLAALLVALVFFLIVVVVYVVRTYIDSRKNNKNFFGEFFAFLDDKQKRTIPTKFLRAFVLLLLAICLAAVICYNVYIMGWDKPKIIVYVEDNKKPPSVLFCPGFNDVEGKSLASVSGEYYKTLKSIKNDKNAEKLKFEKFELGGRGC